MGSIQDFNNRKQLIKKKVKQFIPENDLAKGVCSKSSKFQAVKYRGVGEEEKSKFGGNFFSSTFRKEEN